MRNRFLVFAGRTGRERFGRHAIRRLRVDIDRWPNEHGGSRPDERPSSVPPLVPHALLARRVNTVSRVVGRGRGGRAPYCRSHGGAGQTRHRRSPLGDRGSRRCRVWQSSTLSSSQCWWPSTCTPSPAACATAAAGAAPGASRRLDGVTRPTRPPSHSGGPPGCRGKPPGLAATACLSHIVCKMVSCSPCERASTGHFARSVGGG